jgi:hypothetical protein
MRRIFDIIAAVGLINLLALCLVVLWLWSSDRLDRDRLQQLRELLAPTIAQEAALAAEQAREDARAQQAQEAALRDEHLPPPSEVRLELVRSADAAAAQAEIRLRDQVAHLRRELMDGIGRLQRDRDGFEAERAAWHASIESERTRRTDEQFAKAVRQLELLPARNARDILLNLAATPEGMETCVAYLDAMAPRNAARILRELKDEVQTVVATNLLEALRTFGLPETDPETPHDQQPPARPAT